LLKNNLPIVLKISHLILQTPPPPGDGDTGIDELPVDNYILIGLILGIILIFFFVKDYLKY